MEMKNPPHVGEVIQQDIPWPIRADSYSSSESFGCYPASLIEPID